MKYPFTVSCDRRLSTAQVSDNIALFFQLSPLRLLELKEEDGTVTWRYGEVSYPAEFVIVLKVREVGDGPVTNIDITPSKTWPWVHALGKGLGEFLAVCHRGMLG